MYLQAWEMFMLGISGVTGLQGRKKQSGNLGGDGGPWLRKDWEDLGSGASLGVSISDLTLCLSIGPGQIILGFMVLNVFFEPFRNFYF